MNVTEPMNNLINGLVLWTQIVNIDFKKAAFEKIKRKMLRDDLRRLGKGAFSSVNSTAEDYISNSFAYSSINDFRPIQQNYTSIKILGEENMRILQSNRGDYSSVQSVNKEAFFESWMIRSSMQQFLPQSYPFSDYALRKITSYNQDALVTIRRLTFSHYSKQYVCNKTRFFGLGSKKPMEYRSTMISHPLTYLEERFSEFALESFQSLLRAGGELECTHNYLYHIGKLVDLAMEAQDSLKEEIFIQVIKQTSSKKLIYMRIMCCLCYCVKVPTRLYVPFLNYLYEEDILSDAFPKELLSYCFHHTIKNFDRQRKYSPSLYELYCAFHAKKIPLIIKFPREKQFFIESYTTVEELMEEIISFYNLDTAIEYLLEVNSLLLEKGNLLDCLSHYCQSQEPDYKWKDYQKFKGLQGILVLKNTNDLNHSSTCQSIMYNYTTNQYLRGLYPLTSNEIVKIAALKMHAELDQQCHYIFQYDNLISKRKLRNLNKTQRNNYKKHILKQYFTIRHLSRKQARDTIMKILQKYRGYNTHFFRCEVYVQDYQQSPAWVGLQRDCFLIVEPLSGRIMRTIAYNRISEWGRSRTELCLKVDSIGFFHIVSLQVDVLASIYQSYINYHLQLLNSI